MIEEVSELMLLGITKLELGLKLTSEGHRYLYQHIQILLETKHCHLKTQDQHIVSRIKTLSLNLSFSIK